MTARTVEKAARLLIEGRVKPDPAPVHAFHVTGDTGTHTVVAGAHVQMCTCPATGRCSHIEAVVVRMNATPDEVALMDTIIEQRAADERAAADALFAELGA